MTAKVAATALGGKLAQFVNRGWLIPDVPTYPITRRRIGQSRTTPTFSLSAQELRQLITS